MRWVALAGFLALGLGPVEPSAGLHVYVPNQMGASIMVLDGSGGLIETVDLVSLGFTEHAMPHQVAAAPDGSAWYVTLAGDGFVLEFDRENRLVARTPVAEPGMIAIDPRRDLLYVSRALGAVNPPTSLAVLRASDMELLDEPDIFVPRPHALAVDTVSGRVYTGSLSTNGIASLDFSTGEVRVTDVAGPSHAFVGLGVSPDGGSVVATTQLTDRLLAFEPAPDGELVQIASVPVAAAPYDVTFSPDGASVWFPNQRAGAVTRVDARDWTVSAVVKDPAFQEPHGVVLSPDGATVYVSSHGRAAGAEMHAGAGHDMESPRENGTLALIDAASGKVEKVTEVGPYAAALGIALLP
jgi:DNA-binding beta-propeller fold protein YncE